MAPKRQPKPEEHPPAAAIAEEEASSDSESEEQDSTDEDLQPQQPEQPKSDSDPESEEEESEEEEEEEQKPSEKTPSAKTHQSPLKSESTEASDSESDSDSKDLNSPTASAFTIKPIATKPIPKSPEPKKVAPKSKSKNSKTSNGDGEGGSIEEKKSAKRPAETEQVGKASRGKKSKIANGDENGDSGEGKKPVINRGWSENGEIALLQGMIDYKSKKGADPLLNLSAFHEFIKDLVNDDVTKTKLSEKMRRLKKKYQTNAEKGQNGEDPVFSKPFECNSFELSKKLWGGEGSIAEVSDTKVKSSRNKKDKKDDNVASKSVSKSVGNKDIVLQEEVEDEIEEGEEEKMDILSLFPQLSAAIELDAPTHFSGSKDYVKEIISSMGKGKATELEEGWKDFRVMEYELRTKRAEMMLKQTKAMLDAMKPSKS